MTGRRGILRGMATGAGAGLLAPLANPRVAQAEERAPDVLLIGTSERAPPTCITSPTLPPRLALLAREGFCFDNFRADFPFRRPTWHELLAGCWNPSGAGRRTLAEAFTGRGYETIVAGTPGDSCGTGEGPADAALRRIGAHVGRPFLAVLIFDRAEDAIDTMAATVQPRPHGMQRGKGLVAIYVPPFSWRGNSVGTRPPLIVHAPDRVAGNARSGVAMNPVDVAPTVCGLAGILSAGSFQGTDYSGLAAVRIKSRAPV